MVACAASLSKWLRANAFHALRSYVNGTTLVTGGAGLAASGSFATIAQFLNPKHRVATDVPYSSHGSKSLLLDVYAPIDKYDKSRSVILFFHGGTWTFFNKDFFRLLGERFRTFGFCVCYY